MPPAAQDILTNIPSHSWNFYFQPHTTWEAMYRDCEQAKTSIEFEQYILENDAVGKRFMELFTRKARAGLKVYLICDRFGSSLLHRSFEVNNFRNNGGILHFYNPVNGWRILKPWRWFPRTHTKTLLIDSEIAYTGGVCLAERMRNWRDTHVRVTGPVVEQIREAFDDIESRIERRHAQDIPKRQKIRDFMYLMNRPRQTRHAIYREFIKAVNAAEKYIYITSAYFIPNKRFLKVMKKAHDRGVEIKVLVPEHSDVVMADWLRLSYTKRFFESGLRLFHYQETVLHSKTAIIDDKWGTVGSTNFDVISFFHNREANIVITDGEAIGELKQQFLKDMQNAVELTPERWNNIPLWKKIAGFAVRAIKVFFG